MRSVACMSWPRLVAVLAAVVAATVLVTGLMTGAGRIEGATAIADPPVNQGALELVSRPDLHPPSLSVTLRSAAATSGYYFVTQGSPRYGDTGPMIVDGRGQPGLGRPSSGGPQRHDP